MRQLTLGVRIPDRAVFASFFAGANVQAVAHLQALARGASGTVWLCGPQGSGKTHLLQATCTLASEQLSSGYFPITQLAPLGPESLEGLTQLDCVCLDDLDAVVGDPDWERALFAVHRELDERGARLVATAREPPALLRWSLRDLGSRFAASAIFALRSLDESQQLHALQLRAQLRGLELPADTARWLQRRFPRDMHTLYELLDTLDEAALEARRRLTVPFIREVLASRGQA